MKSLKNIFLLIPILLILWQSNAYAKVIKCKIQFGQSQANFNPMQLNQCFGNAKASSIISIDMYTNPSPTSNSPQDKVLWQTRSLALRKEILKKFPTVKVNPKSANNAKFLVDAALVVVTQKDEQVVVQKCPVCERVSLDGNKTKRLNTKLWTGVEFIYIVGDMDVFVTQFFTGNLIGFSQTFIPTSTSNEIYVSLLFDFANTSQNVVVGTTPISAIFYMMDLQFLMGIEHFFNKSNPNSNSTLSTYADSGVVIGQRAFLAATSSGTINSYGIYVSLGLGLNGGVNYVYKYNEKLGFLGKFNVNVIVGVPKTQSIYSPNGAAISSANTNPILIMPSFSAGLRF